MAKKVTIIGGNGKEPILTASSLLITACHFSESASIIQKACPDISNNAPNLKYFKARYFLLGHAIETGLKAFLFLHGRSRKNLRDKKGHDLYKILRDAKSLGFLCLNDAEGKMITDLNKYYSNKDFEYEEMDYSRLPTIKDLQFLSKKILNEVRKEVQNNSA